MRAALRLRAEIRRSRPIERQVRGRLFAFYDWCATLAPTISRWEEQIVTAVLTDVTERRLNLEGPYFRLNTVSAIPAPAAMTRAPRPASFGHREPTSAGPAARTMIGFMSNVKWLQPWSASS